jgi:hypothetical protein
VFYIVREQIVQGEAVMAGYEVDALLRLTLRAPVDVRASEQPIRNTREPFRKQINELTNRSLHEISLR